MAWAATTTPRATLDIQGRAEKRSYVMTTGTSILKGDIVILVAATGLAIALVADASVGTGDAFVGISAETKLTAAASTSIDVYDTGTFVVPTSDTAADGAIGNIAYADCHTSGNQQKMIIGISQTHDMACGLVVGRVSTTHYRVKIDGVASCPAGIAT